MTLIKIQKRLVSPLPTLARLALRYVYDREHMTADQIDMMQRSIVAWAKKADMTEDERENLERIGKFLKKDEDGEWEYVKDTIKRHNINWAKFHRVPDMEELAK